MLKSCELSLLKSLDQCPTDLQCGIVASMFVIKRLPRYGSLCVLELRMILSGCSANRVADTACIWIADGVHIPFNFFFQKLKTE